MNYQDHKGKTALHRAARAGFVPTLKVLVEAGADFDVVDSAGETALFDAVRSTIKDFDKQKAAIKLLRSKGCKLSHENRRGQTVQAVASRLKTDKRKPLMRILRT